MRTAHPILAAVLLFAFIQGCATVAPRPATKTSAESMSEILTSIKDKYKLNAIIFTADQNGKSILRTALGISDKEPATLDMHFRIGGIGWQYLVTVMLKMVEQKQLSLSDPVSKWYPNYPHASKITVRMLAASSAGLGEYIFDEKFVKELTDNPLRIWTANDLIEVNKTPQFDNPGANWAYSHTNFVMLGEILEKVSGKPYAKLLDEMVLKPLGFKNTRLQFDTTVEQPVLHTFEGVKDTTFYNPSFVSWAALTSNISELSAWNKAFGTGSLLSAESRKEITAKSNVGLGPIKSDKAYFGLGTSIFEPWIFGNAGFWGMHTATAYDPKTDISLAVTVAEGPNSQAKGNPADEIMHAMMKLFE